MTGSHICFFTNAYDIFTTLNKIFKQKLHTCLHIQNTNTQSVKWQSQIFYICKPYFFLHIYDPFSIPCWPVIFVLYLFSNAYEVLLQFITISHLTCMHMFIYTKTNAQEVFSWQSQIFYLYKSCMFLNIHDSFSIPCFSVIFGCIWGGIAYDFFTTIHMHIWQPYFFLM